MLSISFSGLEEFEEKIEALGEEEEITEDGENWINSLVKEFANVKKEVEEELKIENGKAESTEMPDLEPPDLQTRWGLNLMNGTRQKRETGYEEFLEPNSIEDGGSDCRVGVWRCLSGVLEGGVRSMDRPGGVMG